MFQRRLNDQKSIPPTIFSFRCFRILKQQLSSYIISYILVLYRDKNKNELFNIKEISRLGLLTNKNWCKAPQDLGEKQYHEY